LIYHDQHFLGETSLLSSNQQILKQAQFKNDLTKNKNFPRSFHLGLENFKGVEPESPGPVLTNSEQELVSSETTKMKEVFSKIRSMIQETPNMDHICGKFDQKS
jgi:hypothetical protein